jgi:hypothetical protein
LTWGGYQDWRLPDQYELQSIADYSITNPSIDLAVFPRTHADIFWCSSSLYDHNDEAYAVDFSNGEVLVGETKDNGFKARCVRGDPQTVDQRWTLLAPELDQRVVADDLTSLMWQSCELGLSGAECGVVGTTLTSDWAEALAGCYESTWGGYDDWYLPNVKEMMSLIDTRYSMPAVDASAFAYQTGGRSYWTSSTTASDPSTAWMIHIDDGHTSSNQVKTTATYVRCARRMRVIVEK